MIGPFHKSPQDKLAQELEQLEKTKAELERQARELESVLNIPPQPKSVEQPTKGARFMSMDEDEHPLQSPAIETTARLKVEQRRAKRRVLTLVAIVGILLLIILRMIS